MPLYGGMAINFYHIFITRHWYTGDLGRGIALLVGLVTGK